MALPMDLGKNKSFLFTSTASCFQLSDDSILVSVVMDNAEWLAVTRAGGRSCYRHWSCHREEIENDPDELNDLHSISGSVGSFSNPTRFQSIAWSTDCSIRRCWKRPNRSDLFVIRHFRTDL